MSAAEVRHVGEQAAALERRWIRFTTELARNEVLVAALLRRHRADPDGMCTGCTTGGTGTHETPWPCTLHSMAAAAGRVAASTRSGSRQARDDRAQLVVIDGDDT